MDQFLTQPIADAICTLIVLGYAKNQSGPAGGPVFEYPKDATDQDIADHKNIQKLFKGTGLDIGINQSIPQSDFSFIVAKTPKVSTLLAARAELNANYGKFLIAINGNANASSTPPKGAYIGGMSNTSTMFIVGPSKLDFAPAQYRILSDADSDKISTQYVSGIQSANTAVQALKDYKASANPVKITYVDLIDIVPITPGSDPTKQLPRANLFKSYHGMIQAMIKYQTDISNSFIFEIALGKETSKVSSCFPCSTFMAANNKPATSTHLGRGDNWNIPSGGDAMKILWSTKINEWYNAAKLLPITASNAKLKSALAVLAVNSRETNIPAIFLECLTFEGKFSDKLLSTLN